MFFCISISFAHLETDIHSLAYSLDLSLYEHQFSSLTTDFQEDLGLEFDWASLTHELSVLRSKKEVQSPVCAG